MTTETLVDAEPTYTAEEVSRLTGASYRQLTYWVRLGHLPDDRPEGNRTSGRPLTFTARELDIVRLVLHLLAAGFTLEAAFGISVRLADEDSYSVRLADIFRLSIVIDTIQPDDHPAVDAPTSQEASE